MCVFVSERVESLCGSMCDRVFDGCISVSVSLVACVCGALTAHLSGNTKIQCRLHLCKVRMSLVVYALFDVRFH